MLQTRQYWRWLIRLCLFTIAAAQESLIDSNAGQDVIIVDGFVDTTSCYENLVLADADGNNDGKLQADEFVVFSQMQTPGGELDEIDEYQEMPLVMQATFVTLTCLCRDERFGGDPRDVNCCLGVDAHIAIVGNDAFSTSQEATRLFATCFLTDQAIQQVLGSQPPSHSPTIAPSFEPTPDPTVSPSEEPTPSPSSEPTSVPTPAPTTSEPTLTPTTSEPTTANPTGMGPTSAPTTAAPTSAAPTTASPTSSPTTLAPTTETPTESPTSPAPVTTEPTSSPTTMAPIPPPTTIPPIPFFTQEAQAVYTISVKNGAVENIATIEYEPDLITAMNILATDVVTDVFALQKRRKLQVILQTPTSIEKYEETNCTQGLATPSDRCENVDHIITLVDTVALNQAEVDEFESALTDAILRGELQANLPNNSIVTILSGLVIPNFVEPMVPPEDSGLSGGAVTGIVIAALAVTILPICVYMAMRRGHEEKEPYGAYEPHEAGSAEIMLPEEDIEARSPPKAIAGSGRGTLGASPPDYGKSVTSSTSTAKQVHKVVPASPERDAKATTPGSGGPSPADRSYDGSHAGSSSSNAGSSGWSSSAGLSSLNTGSAEDSMDMLNSPQGSSLAAIGAASAVARRMENRRNISPMSAGIEELDVPAGAVSRNDLDNAIEAGDWAAVGATAALLAAASDSQSASSKSRQEESRASRSRTASVSSVDAARAAELDHLVDAGDWEGVVLAAAKFEAQEGSIRSGTASGNASVRSSSAGSDTGTGSRSGTFTPSVSTSISESPSKAQKRDEIRQEVEALVRRVVPEELDNVDEMMLQFKGREEELVETLRTMQERAVAQKARTAGHKAAKQEARRTVHRGGLPGSVPPPAPATSSTAAPAQAAAQTGQSSSAMASEGSAAGKAQHKRTALEQAIEAGDWEAVGEAAAMMSDTSMASASTAELERLAAGARLGSTASGGTSSRSLRISGVNADRARELDEMIDRGDWAAVVEAAGRFNQADKEASSHASADYSAGKRPSRTTGAETTDTASKRTKQLQEEEDALAQAEIWMQIAQQSKVEGATDAGASDAADWAIARSLKSLKKAEEQGEGSATGVSHQGSQSGADDDESV